MTDVVALARRLVRCDSCDPPGREIEIATLVHEHLLAGGLESELDRFRPGRANVVARLRGGGRREALVFSAHFDTMPPGVRPWRHDPFAADVEDGRLYGRGAADMKGGMAAMIVAAGRLAAAGGRLGGDLVLAFSAGESSSCLGAKRMVERRQLAGAGALLVSEPSSMEVLLAEKGALWLRIAAHGRPGHPSAAGGGAGTGGESAIERLLDALVRLRSFSFGVADHPLLGAPQAAIGTVSGGTVVNLTPDFCQAELDLRLLPGMDPDAVQAALMAHLGADLACERIDYKPPLETDAGHPFARLCLDAAARLQGRPMAPGGASYYSDAAVLAPAFGLARVVIGPGRLGMSGQADEYVETAELRRAAALFETIARAWLGDGDAAAA